ncbi:MAG TPA: hypothetical protein VLN49_25585 [Gemmatimonadaceae bacterium]|nr:hypothetical protein [Gemmatimonadaceae bacterium]
MRRFEAYHSDRDLPTEGRRVDLHGSLRTVQWPPYCANCCAPATSKLVVEKIFRRMQGGSMHGRGWAYVIRRARIPYCPACMAKNAEIVEASRMPLPELVLRVVATPLVIPFVGAALVAKLFLPDVVSRPLGNPLHNVGLGVLVAMLFTMFVSVFGSWRATRFHLVPPLNEITAACDFSDELGSLMLGRHRAFVLRNEAFAQAFVDANRERLWTARDTVRTDRLKAVLGTVLIAGLIATRVLWVK